jgi:hypothetical protein
MRWSDGWSASAVHQFPLLTESLTFRQIKADCLSIGTAAMKEILQYASKFNDGLRCFTEY